jgi:hypothetical protein
VQKGIPCESLRDCEPVDPAEEPLSLVQHLYRSPPTRLNDTRGHRPHTKRAAWKTVLVMIAFSLPSYGTTYYVDARGGKDTNSGVSKAAAWQTITKVNTFSFAAGDVIRFKRGERFRGAALRIPSSGRIGAPITISDYGLGELPIIDGSEVVTGWSWDSGHIYYAHWTFMSNAVWQNDTTPLHKKASKAAMTQGSFFCDTAAARIYVWTTTGTPPIGFTIEATRYGPQYFGLVYSLNKYHLIIENLRLVKSNYYGIYFEEGGIYIVRRNTLEQIYHNAITAVGNLGQANTSNVIVTGNILRNDGVGRGPLELGESECVGINAQGWITGYIADNVILNQGGEGIQVLAGSRNVTVTRNRIVNPYGTGIYISSGWGNGGNVTGSIVSYNYVELGASSVSPSYTISTEDSKYAIDGVEFNHNHSEGIGAAIGGLLFGSGRFRGVIRNARVHNNVFVNDQYGIKAFGPTDDSSNSFFDNTISVLGFGRAYWIGAPAVGSNPHTNYNIDYDALYSPNMSSFIVEMPTGTYLSLPKWRAVTSHARHTVQSDPLPANPGNSKASEPLSHR